jgi:hypothetical protein
MTSFDLSSSNARKARWMSSRTPLRKGKKVDAGCSERFTHRADLVLLQEIALVARDDLRTLRERRVERRELAVDAREVLQGIASVQSRKVNEMDEDPRPFDVTKESVAESPARVRTVNQPRHVDSDKLVTSVDVDDAEIRHEGRKRVIGDLGALAGDRRDEA